MRLLVQHRSHYAFERPAALGPHKVRLRPANHTRARVETYALRIAQPCDVRWQQDPYGNHVAEVSFRRGTRVDALDLQVELAIDVRPVNPFDFFLDPQALRAPFEYPRELRQDLLPFLLAADPSLYRGDRVGALLGSLPRDGDTVGLVVELNRRVAEAVRYVIREEPGIWTPEETLAQGRGSCRDSAVLLMAALRSRGLAARFVSGYLVQLTDEGMIPDEPKGVGRDVVDLHAWAEVYLPGAGWLGLDATSGLLCGEGHIPLACTAFPPLAAPVEGTTDTAAREVTFQMRVGRLGHEPRPTRPYTGEVWEALLERAAAADRSVEEDGLRLTSGGEPTFNSREHPDAPEWNAEAMGPTKDAQALRLVEELRRRLCPGAAALRRTGKLYPGESLPRWALELVGRRDGEPVWTGPLRPGGGGASVEAARELGEALCDALGIDRAHLVPAYEDPWRALQDEARLPVDVDPLRADARDPEERRRLARVLDRGLATEAGFALPLARLGGLWVSDRWSFRRGRLYLVPGDSPMGLRLPLGALGPGWVPSPAEPAVEPPDPRGAQERLDVRPPPPPPLGSSSAGLRTALCVEPRDGALHVFIPPLAGAADFFDLVGAVDRVRAARGATVLLDGYPPPADPSVFRFSVTPDPGVLEVNVPPSPSAAEHARVLDAVFESALHAGLHSEKYLLDGRVAGSGGGHHLTLGGPSPLQSPFVLRPDVLASLVTFTQHHPSLSYLFTGLFVGPTSQAPRVDEARHDALYELEIAL
ncbi:MAG TPA: transglutaminase family protein, partial [Myxococcales bacterium]|nr:transglutaminase family protein [Myxococcales bacterium]